MLEFLTVFHARFANTAMLYFAVVSLWGYFRFFRRQGIDPAYWGALVIAEIIVIVEVLIGIYLWANGLAPARPVHFLYGALIPIMIPAAYLYTRGRAARAENMIYATATLITVGFIIRAIYTAQVIP
jgi:hypothetical protein